jgi:hypothetical protein
MSTKEPTNRLNPRALQGYICLQCLKVWAGVLPHRGAESRGRARDLVASQRGQKSCQLTIGVDSNVSNCRRSSWKKWAFCSVHPGMCSSGSPYQCDWA